MYLCVIGRDIYFWRSTPCLVISHSLSRGRDLSYFRRRHDPARQKLDAAVRLSRPIGKIRPYPHSHAHPSRAARLHRSGTTRVCVFFFPSSIEKHHRSRIYFSQHQQRYIAKLPLRAEVLPQYHHHYHAREVNYPPIPRRGQSTGVDRAKHDVYHEQRHREIEAFLRFLDDHRQEQRPEEGGASGRIPKMKRGTNTKRKTNDPPRGI